MESFHPQKDKQAVIALIEKKIEIDSKFQIGDQFL